MTDPNQTPGFRGDRRTVILMRHAKSDWSGRDLSDHDRPLNKRGRRDAPRMARWLAENDLIPDLILSSSSVRTRETVAMMITVWADEPVVSYSEELYHSAPEDMIRAIRSDGRDARRLMVVAHNPGMASLVSHWAGDYTEMPTAAIAVFDAECEQWNSLDENTEMKLVEHMRPKAL